MGFSIKHYCQLLEQRKSKEALEYRVSFTPNYLYKFYWLNEIENEVKDKKLIDSNEQKFSTLKNNQLWFALPKYQNDPYEFKGMYLEREQLYAMGVQSEGIDEVEKKFQNVPICCFVANSSTNMPMWAHYANNHKGYCVKYKVHNKYAARSVIYEPNRIPIATIFTNFITAAKKLDEGIGKIEDVQFYSNILQEMMFIKHESWSAEKEFRIVYPTEQPIKRGVYAGVKDVGLEVSEIICGYKCSEEHISKLAQIAETLGVPCTKCKLSETDFTVYDEVKRSNG